MRKLLLLCLLVFAFSSVWAQVVDVSGSIKNSEDKQPIHYAIFSLVNAQDSFLYKFTRSNADGSFSLKNIVAGNYILIVSHPRFADLVEDISITKNLNLPVLELTPKSKVLQEIIIKTGSPLRIKGDTTIYTADSFVVSANANVEELLKKLPGLQVDKDGTIKAMGKTVQKVLVDGEEFFGDDPGMAVRNIRADAVKEVQVFDKKSDQAEFTGIDDGKTQKTINLKLKDNKKHGYFGKVVVASGIQKHIPNRHVGNLLFGSFKGKRKISAFLMTDNSGDAGIAWDDALKYGTEDNIDVNTDNGIAISFNGTSDDEPYIDPQNGFLDATKVGFQYNNKWNDNQALAFSPRYQRQQYESKSTGFTKTQVGDSSLISNSANQNRVDRNNFKNRLVMEWALDSMNSIKVTANANFYHTSRDMKSSSETYGASGTPKNTSQSESHNATDKSAISGKVLYRRKFKKPRRTLSLGGDWNIRQSNGTQFLNSLNQSYFNGSMAGSQAIDQKIIANSSSQNITGDVTYTEPLGKELSLELNYGLILNNGKNNQSTYERIPNNKDYTIIIDSLSNQFRQNIVQNTPGMVVNFANKKLNANIGMSVGLTSYRLKDLTFNKNYDRNYTNFYPSSNIKYTYKPNHSIVFNYSGRTSQPSINQLQPLRNNTDYYNQYIGNPDLKPAFSNSFSINMDSYNFLKGLWSYYLIQFSTQNNAITTSRIIDLDSGKTITQPVNVDGNYSLSFYSGMGFTINKLKVNFQMSPSLDLRRNVEIINHRRSFTKSISPSLSVNLRKDKAKKFELALNNQISYNWDRTEQNNTTIHYLTNDLNLVTTVYFRKVWSVICDYEFYTQQPTKFNKQALSNHLLNAQVQRTFRDDAFTVYVKVRDILNQNTGLERYFSGSTYSEETNVRLRRYFMLGFTWNFKNK